MRPCIWVLESFKIKEKQPLTKKWLESIESSRFDLQRAIMSGEFDSKKDSQSTKFSKLSDLHAYGHNSLSLIRFKTEK